MVVSNLNEGGKRREDQGNLLQPGSSDAQKNAALIGGVRTQRTRPDRFFQAAGTFNDVGKAGAFWPYSLRVLAVNSAIACSRGS